MIIGVQMYRNKVKVGIKSLKIHRNLMYNKAVYLTKKNILINYTDTWRILVVSVL